MPRNKKAYGLNFTELLFQLVPLNNGNSIAGPIGYSYKRWGKKAAFRFSLGAAFEAAEDPFDEFNIQFYLGLGWERLQRRYGKWQFNNGAEIALFTGAPRGLVISGSEEVSIAYAPFYEFQYHVNEAIYIAASARLVFGFSVAEFVPVISVVPPLGIFVYVKL